MGDSGGTAEITLTCGRDGTATRLRCAACQAPICPECYVRTPVGLRCPDCSVSSVPPVREAEARRRWPVPAAIAAVVALGLAGVAFIGVGRDGPEPAAELGGPDRATVAPVQLGAGELPLGGWTLHARRDGAICVTLTLSPGPPSREECHPVPPAGRGIAFARTRPLRLPAETVYLTMGIISEQTERVVVAPEGETAREAPVLGGGANLGARFFVVHTSAAVTTFTALAADGSELGRLRSPPQRN
jgi:hypothetical protein